MLLNEKPPARVQGFIPRVTPLVLAIREFVAVHFHSPRGSIRLAGLVKSLKTPITAIVRVARSVNPIRYG